jgi:simple sugar transport system ATP-binding protein
MQIELSDIRKSFGSVQANAGISLLVPPASIQGILGENGAGKSTLMKILSGFIRPDSGDILVDGRRVVIHSPADAIRLGVGMLHQDPLDFPPMKILDNFILGRSGAVFPDRRKAAREFGALAAQFDFNLDADAYVDTQTVGERQQLEILRLLWFGARTLILDEPTTGISQPQKEKLFDTLKRLSAKGMTIIFVSHKLEDVELLCSRIAVLRQGGLVGTAVPPYETKSLVRMMFTRDVAFTGNVAQAPGKPVLTLAGVSLEAQRLQIQRALPAILLQPGSRDREVERAAVGA